MAYRFTDTHCHIHEVDYPDAEAAYQRALDAGVSRMVVVGTGLASSIDAVRFALAHTHAWAAIGIHPHETAREGDRIGELRIMLQEAATDPTSRVVAIGEIGLDYYYNHSPKEVQIRALREQIELAISYELPIIFHVREAFDDFWPIFDSYEGLRGVLHSYTDNLSNLDKALSRGLLIGVNGIATFAGDKSESYRAIPLSRMLLETDAPFLTPHPHRGTVNEPALLQHVAQSIANLQSINLEELSRVTEASATELLNLK